MFALGDAVIYSATDVGRSVDCEFALARRLDEVLERIEKLEVVNLVRDRAAALGDAHEERVLQEYRDRFEAGVVEIEPIEDWTAEQLTAQHEATLGALRSGAPVITQGGFFDGRFHGRADFLVREGAVGGRARYAVVDAKLARRAKGSALLQVAAYADQLVAAGVPVADATHLHLGNDVVTSHSTSDSLVVLRQMRARVEELIATRFSATEPIPWGDESVHACGWCDHCRAALAEARDVRLVWGLRRGVRDALRAAGIATIDELAASAAEVPGVNPRALERFRTQARMQLRQEQAVEAGEVPSVFAQVHTLEPLDQLPTPDPGDVFFDFEGDPMWVDDDRTELGLEYLFGLIEAPTAEHPEGRYVTFWAHDRAQERQALVDFLAYLQQRRAEHPGMHVYHYAFYEPAALRRLAQRHQVGRQEVAELLDAGVFVDLYETVKRGVHTSQRSYSIKKLEPLYMGDRLRDSDGVTDGGASVVAYAEAAELRENGDEAGWAEHMHSLADYNRYDCESTMRLRDWLLTLREEAHRERLDAVVAQAAAALGGEPVAEVEMVTDPLVQVPEGRARRLRDSEVLARRLRARAADADSDADAEGADPALPLLAAALTYHRTENQPFWDSHRARLAASAPDWSDERDVLDVHRATGSAWEKGRSGLWHRRLRLTGRLGAGSTVEPGADAFCVYRPPLPLGMTARVGALRATSHAKVLTRWTDAGGLDVIEVDERLAEGVGPHAMEPVLLTPGPPPRTSTLEDSIAAVAGGVLGEGDAIAGAALDVLRRTPPRQGAGALPPVEKGGVAAAVTAALLDSQDSYLGVQGPPGTGKSALCAEVIAALVREHGWRIGVVAQSHTVVEQLLDRVVAEGVPADQVGKRAAADSATTGAPWQQLGGGRAHLAFLEDATHGCVLGGTAWDFANRGRVPTGALDLLVVEEAGQFSLANLLATATAARRLLLVGDPQQLPQVSQARHAEPVDSSALGWLMEGQQVLPAERGYLLDRTWRMHPALCAAVSRLSYDDRLRSAEVAAARHLEGFAPGVHEVLLEHNGHRARSPEEAAEVAAQVENVLGREWTDEHGTRPLDARDVVVVAAYNAQVQAVAAVLEARGLGAVRVGTVDRFQGQEAVVTVLTLAASSAEVAARGLPFLLDRNRVNVALSRGQWAAVIVRSAALTRAMPTRPRELADLAGFLRVSEAAETVRAASA